jgi:hypothetical protein
MDEIDIIHLGDSLFSLIQKGSELFVLELIKGKNNAEVLVKINPIYCDSLIVSSVTISQLPMIVSCTTAVGLWPTTVVQLNLER